MNKMIKCKSCGAEIAKTANRCPQCGAKQHIGALVACVIIAFIAVIAIAIVIGSSGKSADDPSGEPNDATVSFSGDYFDAKYIKCSAQDGVSGCFYVIIDITNKGSASCTYLLSDVYVNDYHCESGTALPITALPGKSVKGSFIVFCETPLSDVSNVNFKLSVMDSDTMSLTESSSTVSITPNA